MIEPNAIRALADNPWAEYLPDVHKVLHQAADEIEKLRRVAEAADSLLSEAREEISHWVVSQILSDALRAWKGGTNG